MADKLTLEEQVALMLRKAETGTPEEAEMLTARAAHLMLKHGIDRTMAEAAGTQPKDNITWFEVSFTGVYAKAYIFAVHDIVRAFGNARGYLIPFDLPKKGMTYRFCSFSKDGVELKALVESLMIQCNSAVADHIEAQDYAWSLKTASQKYNDKRSFVLGFGRETASRIAKERREAIQEVKASSTGNGAELVLVSKKVEVEKYFERSTGKMGKARGMQTSVNGYLAGRAAGREANIGAGRKAID